MSASPEYIKRSYVVVEIIKRVADARYRNGYREVSRVAVNSTHFPNENQGQSIMFEQHLAEENKRVIVGYYGEWKPDKERFYIKDL